MEVTERIGRVEDHLEQVAAVVSQLAAAQLRTEQRVEDLAAAQHRTEQRVEELTAAQARTEQRVEELAAAQVRTEAQLGALAAAQAHTEQRMAELAAAQRDLTAAQARTEAQLGALRAWQQGESGRRRGERYERNTARSGWRLFGAGQGGSPDQEFARRRLTATMDALPADRRDSLTAQDDPFLADVIWWKQGRVAVVEASIVVDDNDVERARARAGTLAAAGANAVPIVIGDSWADGEVRALADLLRLAWQLPGDVNDRFKEFRALPAE
jgi:hypothetical protein